MHILHIIQLILLFPFVCEAVGEVEWKRGPELPHLTLLFRMFVILILDVVADYYVIIYILERTSICAHSCIVYAIK